MDRLDTASYAGEFVYHFDYTLTGMRDLITEQRNGSTTWTSDYAYDYQDRVTSVTTPNGTVAYTYDPNGNRASMTTPSGMTSYLYNGNDQLTQVAAPMGQTNLTYTTIGLPDTLTYPNGIVKDYSYCRGTIPPTGTAARLKACSSRGRSFDPRDCLSSAPRWHSLPRTRC